MFLFLRLPKSTFKKRFSLPADAPIVSFVPFTVCDDENYVSVLPLCVTWDKSGDVRWARTSWHPLFLQTETTYQDHTVCLWTAVSGRYTQSVIVVGPVKTLRIRTICSFYIFVKEKDWIITEFASNNNHKKKSLLIQTTSSCCVSEPWLLCGLFFKDWIYWIEQQGGSLGSQLIN